MVVSSTVLFAQLEYIYPDVSANVVVKDNQNTVPAGIILFVDIETPDGNYLGWADDNNPHLVTNLGLTYQFSFLSTNTGTGVWNPIPLPSNYYLLNFHCEKRDISNTVVSRSNVYCYGHLDSSNNIIANTGVYLELN